MKILINTLMLIVLFCFPLVERSFSKLSNKKFKFKKLVHNLLDLHLESKTEPEVLMKIMMEMKKDLFKMEHDTSEFNKHYKDLCEKDANSLKNQFNEVKIKADELKIKIRGLHSDIDHLEKEKIGDTNNKLQKEISELNLTTNIVPDLVKNSRKKRLEIEEKIKVIKHIVFIFSSSDILDPFSSSLNFIQLKEKIKNPFDKLTNLLQLDTEDSNFSKMLNMLVTDTILLNDNPKSIKKEHIRKIIKLLFQMKKYFMKLLKDLKDQTRESKKENTKKQSLIKQNIKSLTESFNLFKNTLNFKKLELKESEKSLLNLNKFLNDYEYNALQRNKECDLQEKEYNEVSALITFQKIYLKKIISKFVDYSPDEIKKILKK
jgi:hypothetical protein